MNHWQYDILNKLRMQPVHTEPYPYIFMTDVFPKDVYSELLATLPPASEYEDKATYPGRKTQVCKVLDKYPLWQSVGDFVRSEAFRDVLLERFGIGRQGKSLFYLHRDLDGFHITPHTDVGSKIVSYLFYLAEDLNHAHLGTWMLKPKDAGYKWSEKHKEWTDFDRMALSPYLPNCFFAWHVNDMSYHAVDICFDEQDPVQARNTMRGFVFDTSKEMPFPFMEDSEYHGL